MRFESAFGLASRLVVLSGLFSLFMTEDATGAAALPAAVIALGGMAFPGRFERPVLAGLRLSALVVAAAVFAVFDFFYIGGSLIVAGADFMALLAALKLLSLESDKDYVQLFTVSFFMLLASTGLSTEVYFLLPFTAFFLSLVWALIFLTIRADARAAGAGPVRWRVGRGFFAGTAALTLVSFAACLAIFFAIPRVGIGYFSKRAGGLIRTSGFSDTVDLGSIGQVKLDPTAVMRVEVSGMEETPGRPLYWRGRAFDFYTGSSWVDTLAMKRNVHRSFGSRLDIRPGERAPAGVVTQEIALEPLDTNTIFALYPAYELSADFRNVWVDGSDGLHLPYPPGGRIHYTAYSAPWLPAGREDADDGLPPATAAKYMQLPQGEARLAALAAEVTRGAATPEENAGRIMSHLEENYSYSLDPPRWAGQSPVEDFLFYSRSGYCEHFATAMVLMLRASGVPARMVSGFSGGRYNGYGNYLVVREQDAHTWVEAYVEGKGWVVYDPTPPATADGGEAALFSGITGLFDYLRFRWDRYVVYYNLRDQVGAVSMAADAFRAAKSFLKDMTGEIAAWSRRALTASGAASGAGSGAGSGARSGAGPVIPVAAALAAAGLLAAVSYLFIRKISSRAGTGKRRVEFFESMTRLLRKKGHVRRPGQTPLEFTRALAKDNISVYKDLPYIAEAYNRVRFGDERIGPAERGRIAGILAGLRRR